MKKVNELTGQRNLDEIKEICLKKGLEFNMSNRFSHNSEITFPDQKDKRRKLIFNLKKNN